MAADDWPVTLENPATVKLEAAMLYDAPPVCALTPTVALESDKWVLFLHTPPILTLYRVADCWVIKVLPLALSPLPKTGEPLSRSRASLNQKLIDYRH